MHTPPTQPGQDDLYFRQLLSGRDFAASNAAAAQMVNFAYLIGSRVTGEALVVDPAWDIDGLLAVAAADGMRVVGVLATHYHPDHVGGDLFGREVEGIARLLERTPVKVHVQREEAPWVREMTGVSQSDLVVHAGGDKVTLGDVEVTLVHTPGHSPGSQCFLVRGRLVSGDTLFLQGCGRVDLPGADPEAMFRSLTGPLAALPESTVLYPGHQYDPRSSSTFAEQRRENYVLKITSLDEWLRLMGGD